jgi:hypothetical protein
MYVLQFRIYADVSLNVRPSNSPGHFRKLLVKNLLCINPDGSGAIKLLLQIRPVQLERKFGEALFEVRFSSNICPQQGLSRIAQIKI